MYTGDKPILSEKINQIEDKLIGFLRDKLKDPMIGYEEPLTPLEGGCETYMYRFKLSSVQKLLRYCEYHCNNNINIQTPSSYSLCEIFRCQLGNICRKILECISNGQPFVGYQTLKLLHGETVF